MESTSEILKSFKKYIGKTISLNGRITSVRKMKGHIFVDLLDKDTIVQLYFSDINFSNLPVAGDLVVVKGECFFTKTNEPTIKVNNVSIINHWKASQGYKTIKPDLKSSPLKSFIPGGYGKCIIPFLVRNYTRDFFRSKDFLEVQTPILCKSYNGGRSFPVTTSYLNEIVGYNRGTMEERMQALIGAGFNKIFQIGSVFRSSIEHTFLEAYVSHMDWQSGQNLVRELCQYIAQQMEKGGFTSKKHFVNDLIDNKWQTKNFFEEAISCFGEEIKGLLREGTGLPDFLSKRGLINKKEIYLENIADIIANAFTKNIDTPTIVNNFPDWSSPLYAYDKSDTEYNSLQRSRVYFPGQIGGFDIGVQENDYDVFLKRTQKQQELWSLKSDDERIKDSELQKVISVGLPPMFGIGINPDRISKLWEEKSSIDPFE